MSAPPPPPPISASASAAAAAPSSAAAAAAAVAKATAAVSMVAPDWYREVGGAGAGERGAARPPPPELLTSQVPAPLTVGSLTMPQQPRQRVAPVLPAMPLAPPTQELARPLPAALALPPPPPPPGAQGPVPADLSDMPLALESPTMKGSAGAIALPLSDSPDKRRKPKTTTQMLMTTSTVDADATQKRTQSVATIQNKSRLTDRDQGKALRIPGLQSAPFTEEELSMAWEMMDLDDKGCLQVEELRRTLELCGEEKATDAELKEMIRMVGKQGKDGRWRVRYSEFWRAFTNPPPLFRNWDLHRRQIETPRIPEGVGYESSSSSEAGSHLAV